MGQKVNPNGFRVGVIKKWDTRWYASKKDFADNLVEDYNIREFVKKKYFQAGISKIEIERASNRVMVNIFTGRPGVLIGRGGAGVEIIKKDVEKLTDGKAVFINIVEVKNQDLDAQLVAESIAAQLEKRISFRRAMKQTIGRCMRAGAKGIKTKCSGRLGGAEIARDEDYHEGSIPLQTLRAKIDYGFAEAHTTYGRIGVKVWIYTGEELPRAKRAPKTAQGGEN
jgi:small subunit ribosomal protein S3